MRRRTNAVRRELFQNLRLIVEGHWLVAGGLRLAAAYGLNAATSRRPRPPVAAQSVFVLRHVLVQRRSELAGEASGEPADGRADSIRGRLLAAPLRRVQ